MNDTDDFFSSLEEASQDSAYRQLQQSRIAGKHPSGNLLYEYLLDKLDEESASSIETHLAGCGSCADELLQIMRMEAELTVEAEHQANFIEHQALPQSPELFYWEPYGIGLALTAAETPKQTHHFSTTEGTVELTCDWGTPQGSDPAYIWLAWESVLPEKRILEINFVNPETGRLWHTASLGSSLVGEETFTSHELNFDPSLDRWALALAVKVPPR